MAPGLTIQVSRARSHRRPCNVDYILCDTEVLAWFGARIPGDWCVEVVGARFDAEEIVVTLSLDLGVDRRLADRPPAAQIKAFRDRTRSERMGIAYEAATVFGRTLSWAVTSGSTTQVFTNLSAAVMTRLRMDERQVLDTLIEAGVARSRSDAVAWCVRLVGRHEVEWLADLRDALAPVQELRTRGPCGDRPPQPSADV